MIIRLLLCFSLLFCQQARGQNMPVAFNTSLHKSTYYSPALSSLKSISPYVIQKPDKKVRRARGCIISGAILTGIGGAVFISGCGYVIATIHRPAEPGPKSADPTAPALWISAIPEIAIGVPVLVVGVVKKRRYLRTQNEVQVQAGWINNTNLGLVMRF